MFFTAYFCVVSRPEGKQYKQKSSPQRYKIQIKILCYPSLAQSGFKQLGPEGLFLGFAKSIYNYKDSVEQGFQ